MPFWVKAFLFGAGVWIVVNVFGSTFIWVVIGIVIAIFFFSMLNSKESIAEKNSKMYGLIEAYENSNIEISRAIAYLGGRLAESAVKKLNLSISKKDRYLLEILFMAILFHHMLGVMKVNHMESAVNDRDFKENIVNDIISIIKTENKSLPDEIYHRLKSIFTDYFGQAVLNLPLEDSSIGSYQVAKFVINQMNLITVDVHLMDRIIAGPLKEFNLATAYRIDKSLSY